MTIKRTFSAFQNDPGYTEYQHEDDIFDSNGGFIRLKHSAVNMTDTDYEGEESEGEMDYPDTPNTTDSEAVSEAEAEDTMAWSRSESPSLESVFQFPQEPANRPKQALYSCESECQLCFQKGEMLCSSTTHHPVSIDELLSYRLDLYFTSQDILCQHVIVVAPCGNRDHRFCVGCLRKLTTEYAEQTMRQFQGHLPCPSSSADHMCCNQQNQAFVFSLQSMSCFLTPAECVHWKVTAPRYQESNGASVVTGRFNHYVWSQGKEQSSYYPALLLCDQVKPDNVLTQLQYLFDSDRMEVKCKECGLFLAKTTQCNALSHCGVETCNVCGFSDISIAPEHWKVCPRYDETNTATPLYLCQENVCHDDAKECHDPTHAPGKQQLIEMRRQFHLKALWSSLNENVKAEVFSRLSVEQQSIIHKLQMQ
jgi:hypothetical protein